MEIKRKWKLAFQNKKFRITIVILLISFVCLLFFVSQFQNMIEQRQGVAFIDPLTGELPVFDMDIITFIAIYSAHLVAIYFAFKRPEKFIQLLLGYFFVYLLRIFSQYLMPLEPPPGIIPMKDPILIWFGDGKIINKDLFYSGHTSTTFIAFLVTENRKAKIFIFFALLVVVAGILLQRVHYTIDVYVAFFFAFAVYRIGIFILHKLDFNNFSQTEK